MPSASLTLLSLSPFLPWLPLTSFFFFSISFSLQRTAALPYMLMALNHDIIAILVHLGSLKSIWGESAMIYRWGILWYLSITHRFTPSCLVILWWKFSAENTVRLAQHRRQALWKVWPSAGSVLTQGAPVERGGQVCARVHLWHTHTHTHTVQVCWSVHVCVTVCVFVRSSSEVREIIASEPGGECRQAITHGGGVEQRWGLAEEMWWEKTHTGAHTPPFFSLLTILSFLFSVSLSFTDVYVPPLFRSLSSNTLPLYYTSLILHICIFLPSSPFFRSLWSRTVVVLAAAGGEVNRAEGAAHLFVTTD